MVDCSVQHFVLGYNWVLSLFVAFCFAFVLSVVTPGHFSFSCQYCGIPAVPQVRVANKKSKRATVTMHLGRDSSVPMPRD